MNALVSFETAARHESITKAAEELSVTPGAVGHQVKKLEQHLGLILFTRDGRNVVLTKEGRRLFATIKESFDEIRRETRRLALTRQSGPLNVRTSRMFLRYWLMPRLPRFFDDYPNIDIAFSVGRSSDLPSAENDITVLTLIEPITKFRVRRLLDGTMIPVCSPDYLGRVGTHVALTCLDGHVLLHSSTHPDHWQRWAGELHRESLSTAKNIVLDGDGLTYEAALKGMGVALARKCLVIHRLESGELVTPPGSDRKGFGDYFMVSSPGSRVKGFREFSNWLMARAKEFSAPA